MSQNRHPGYDSANAPRLPTATFRSPLGHVAILLNLLPKGWHLPEVNLLFCSPVDRQDIGVLMPKGIGSRMQNSPGMVCRWNWCTCFGTEVPLLPFDSDAAF